MKKLLTLILFLMTQLAMACPSCTGSMNNPRDQITNYVLIGFIIFLYIPYYIIFRVIKKSSQGSLPASEK